VNGPHDGPGRGRWSGPSGTPVTLTPL